MSENIKVTYEDQDWVEAYKELCVLVVAIPEIKWADLYDEQPYDVSEEYAFPAPAVLFEFNTSEINEKGDNGQLLHYDVTVYIYYNEIRDTYHGSWNQAGALRFGALAKAVHRILHGTKGAHFSPLTRTSQKRMTSPHPGGRLMMMVYNTIIVDNSAVVSYETDLGEDRGLGIGKGPIPVPVEDENPIYDADEITGA